MQRWQSLFRLPFFFLCLFIVVLTASCGSSDKGLFGSGGAEGGASSASGGTSGVASGGMATGASSGSGTGGTPPTCPNGVVCNGVCVDTQTTSSHCGMCGKVCPPRADCMAGLCICPGEETACGDKCVDTLVSLENCGKCGTACPPRATCERGECAARRHCSSRASSDQPMAKSP